MSRSFCGLRAEEGVRSEGVTSGSLDDRGSFPYSLSLNWSLDVVLRTDPFPSLLVDQ